MPQPGPAVVTGTCSVVPSPQATVALCVSSQPSSVRVALTWVTPPAKESPWLSSSVGSTLATSTATRSVAVPPVPSVTVSSKT